MKQGHGTQPPEHLRALVEEVQRVYDEALAATAAKAPMETPPNLLRVVAANAVLRTCMEACMVKMTPFSSEDAGELAVRLASLALSVVPAEAQREILGDFMISFAHTHVERLDKGLVIAAGWGTEGQAPGSDAVN